MAAAVPILSTRCILRCRRRCGGGLSQVVCPNLAHNTPQPISKTLHVRPQYQDRQLTASPSCRICVAAQVITNQIPRHLIASLPRPAY
ncbi:hypothetical protein KCU91_g136, partial [Aureobasidium melanogenum]